MTNDEEILRGHQARRLLDDPLFKAAQDDIERAIVERMVTADAGNKDLHQTLVVMLQQSRAVRRVFEAHVQTGKMAQIEKETAAQRLKKAVGWR